MTGIRARVQKHGYSLRQGESHLGTDVSEGHCHLVRCLGGTVTSNSVSFDACRGYAVGNIYICMTTAPAEHTPAIHTCNTCNTSATHLQLICNTLATHLQHTCNTPATHLQHICNKSATHLQHTCNTPATHLQHTCNTSASHLQHTCNTTATRAAQRCSCQ
jgi:hypothetical protein